MHNYQYIFYETKIGILWNEQGTPKAAQSVEGTDRIYRYVQKTQ